MWEANFHNKDMNVHIKQNHKTNVLTCDVCSFKSEDADTLSNHKTEQHEIKCDYCDFITQWKESHDLHLAEHHKFRCTKCKLAHNDSWKHNIHTCKVDIDNPTFKSFYTKAWLDQNGCNPVYCTERNEDVAWLHNDKCWSGELPCSWIPHIYIGKSLKPGKAKHLEYSKFVRDTKICCNYKKNITLPYCPLFLRLLLLDMQRSFLENSLQIFLLDGWVPLFVQFPYDWVHAPLRYCTEPDYHHACPAGITVILRLNPLYPEKMLFFCM